MSTIERSSSPQTARLRGGRSVDLLVGGLAAVAVGRVLLQAGEQAWLGATRSPTYVGPAWLLGTGSSGGGAVVVGAIVSLVGLAALLVGLWRLTCAVDVAVGLVGTPRARGFAPSATLVTAGLLAVALGDALYEGIQLAGLTTSLGSGLRDAVRPGQLAGVVVLTVGLAVLLLGVYRLVTNVQALANAVPVPAAASET